MPLPHLACATPGRVLQVHRRPRTGGRKRKSMDGAARLRVAVDEPAAAAEPAYKRKRKSAPAAKAAAADKGAQQLHGGVSRLIVSRKQSFRHPRDLGCSL